jgi:hypothetical protein
MSNVPIHSTGRGGRLSPASPTISWKGSSLCTQALATLAQMSMCKSEPLSCFPWGLRIVYFTHVLTSSSYTDGGIIREGVQGQSADGEFSTGVSPTQISPL